MIEIRLAPSDGVGAIALPVGVDSGHGGRPSVDPARLGHDETLGTELSAYMRDTDYRAQAGGMLVLDRPARQPAAVLLAGVGSGDERGWQSAGAGLVRAAVTRWPAVEVRLPGDTTPAQVRAFAEGATLASYRYRLSPDSPEKAPRLTELTLTTALPEAAVRGALTQASALTSAVVLARDLTNTPSREKSPAWFVEQVTAAAAQRPGVDISVRTHADLVSGGFGGLLAVGSGSPRPPHLLQLSWRPSARRGETEPVHVVLVGKGITFDSGGYSLKSPDGMKLMRKDMAGAAAVCATLLAVADLGLPVRVTALAALAENLVSGSAYRPGDVIRHYGGRTSEVQNTDAEGRLVLADALAYAEQRLAPDYLVDIATLTGASFAALGRKIAALLTEDDALALALTAAGAEVGEPVWRMPLVEDYVSALASDVADLNNAPVGGAGLITAGLFLREFTGSARPHWAHIDMAGPSWTDSNDGALSRGATGWGVRLLTRWLGTL